MKPLLVIALGGNALLQRGQPLEAELLVKNSQQAAASIAALADRYRLLIVHGNGPQIGLLALQTESYKAVHAYPFDILCAESQGMIGYVLQQALNNQLHSHRALTLLTQVIVDPTDPAFSNPTKFIGPLYTAEQMQTIQQKHSWAFKKDEKDYRRVVPSPRPQSVQELAVIQELLEKEHIVIAGGGGGIPCFLKGKKLQGIEAVIDKDATASLLAQQLEAEHLVILTDVEAVYENWGQKNQQPIRETTVQEISQKASASGSMQPKITAACEFVKNTKCPALIGHLFQLDKILAGEAGRRITVK